MIFAGSGFLRKSRRVEERVIMETITTQPHGASQPGLRGHSHDPEFDLMKRFIVWSEPNLRKGWLGLRSFHTTFLAEQFARERNFFSRVPTRISDERNNGAIIWESENE